ncbi:MAG: hypothetical protein ACLGQH_01640 [Acidobacteriota bacterium]
MRHACRAVLLVLSLLALSAALALAQGAGQEAKSKPAQPQAAPSAPEAAPKKADEGVVKKTPVAIDHDDADPVGARLAYRLKELLGRSSLMAPTNKDEKKLVLVIKTKEEFPGRPNLCSIYSVSWLFSSREGSLKYFLASEAGIVDASSVDQTAEALLGRTDKLAATYGYLF